MSANEPNGHYTNGRHAQQPQPDLAAVDDMLFAVSRGSYRMFASWLKDLYHEGREFSEMDDSDRWQDLIGSNPFYKAASVVWSIANMDAVVLGADDPVDDAPPPPNETE